MINPKDLYHTGIVVANLDVAAEDLTKSTGVNWRPERTVTVDTRTSTGILTVPFRMLYSVEGPPFIELIEGIPGTIWSAAGGSRLHHIGYWAADVAAESERLEALGLHREGGDDGPDGFPKNFSYHSQGNGVLIELINSAGRSARFPDVYRD